MPRILIVVLALVLGTVQSASAHKLSLFAMAEGTEIVGKAAHAGGSPAAGTKIRIQAPDGTVVAETAADEKGSFRFQATERMDYVILAETGDGHAERTEVHWETLSESLPMAKGRITIEGNEPHEHAAPAVDHSTNDQIDKAIARQIRPLREELAAFKDEIRFRDVIGGVGYIFGIVGLVAWFSARRRKESDT